MALVVADRVQQTGTANTTVSFTLSGSVTGFQSFAVIGDTNTTYYAATDGSGNWEVGVGTYSTTGPTLTRTTILSSSNSGSAVTFSGAVNVFVTYPSGEAVYYQDIGGVVITEAGTADALRVTNTGTGNSFLVEDAANPDASPFLIDATGFIASGITAPVNVGGSQSTRLQIHSAAGSPNSGMGIVNWNSATAQTALMYLSKSLGGAVNTRGIVTSGTILSRISSTGDDGTTFVEAARIDVYVDGTPGTNDMPGRLVFSTTADGASSPTERMRIDSSGDVGIGTTTPTARLNVVENGSQDALRVTNTGTGNSFVVEDSANPDGTPFIIDVNGNIIKGYTTTLIPVYTTPTGAATQTPSMQFLGTQPGNAAIALGLWSVTAAAKSGVTMYRSRGTNISDRLIVVSGDTIGSVDFLADDGVSDLRAASIIAFVDGTPGVNDMPGRLVFSTTADGASSPTERMRITSAGDVGIGNTPSGSYKLEVTGKTYASGGFVPRPTSITSASTITPTSDASDQYNVTALAVPATLAAPSGTPTDGQRLTIRIKDNGTARALTWTTGSSGSYRAIGVTLPTTTVISKTVYIGCIYNTADSRWDAVAVAQEA